MSKDSSPAPKEGFSLSRWSRRKHAAARFERSAQAPAGDMPKVAAAEVPVEPAAPASPQLLDTERPESLAPPTEPAASLEHALPPLESLRFESDFSAFMKPGVDADLRRAALKRLLHDPSFNVMDGLDTYIDDYSKPDPLPPGMLEKLAHVRAIFGPFADGEAPKEVPGPDLLNVAPPGAALPDAARPGAGTPDAAMPDAAMPSAAMPSAAMPSAATPGAATPGATTVTQVAAPAGRADALAPPASPDIPGGRAEPGDALVASIGVGQEAPASRMEGRAGRAAGSSDE